VKALIQWLKSNPRKGQGPKANVSDEAAMEILNLFRIAQRARNPAEWVKKELAAFEAGIDAVSRKHGCNAAVIKAYFRENWWNETWLSQCCFSC